MHTISIILIFYYLIYSIMNTTIDTSLPWWQILVKEEKIVKKDSFISSLLTFYIKSEFAITNKRFVAHYPKIILGIFPWWFNNITFSIKQISWVQIDVSYKIFRMLVWIILWFIWFSTLAMWWMGLLLLILGILMFASWIQTYIKVVTSWWITYCPILFWEKSKAETIVQNINTSIAENF